MEPKKLTLGQGIDAMLEGKEVVIGGLKYRFNITFQTWIEQEGEWLNTQINQVEVNHAESCCHIYTPPIKWKKITWLEALKVAMIDKKQVKMVTSGEKSQMVDYTDFHYMRIEWIYCTENSYYIEDTE